MDTCQSTTRSRREHAQRSCCYRRSGRGGSGFRVRTRGTGAGRHGRRTQHVARRQDARGRGRPSLIDGGPTVFTMRWVFDELFAAAGALSPAHLGLQPAGRTGPACLGPRRHGSTCLPTPSARPTRSGSSPGPADARGYLHFCRARQAHLRHARSARSSAPRGRHGRSRWSRAVGRRGSASCGDQAVQPRCGRRWASTSATRGCASCSAATPPMSAPRRSGARRR